MAGQVDTTNVFSEQLTFKNLPPLNLEYWKFYVENSFSIGSLTPPNAYADEDPNILGEVTTGAYDFGYNTGSKSATAADDGLPLGDPRWTLFTPVSAKTIDENPNSVKTYPNPFANTITFEIECKESASAKIIIFDLMGKELITKQIQVAQGHNPVQLNLGSSINSGIYLYQVQVDKSESKPIYCGKIIKK